MSEAVFIDINTRFMIISALLIIIVLLMYIAFYRKPTHLKH